MATPALDPQTLAALRADAVRIIPPAGSGPVRVVLTCEHASPVVPAPWRDLGLSKAQLNDHIGWDPGAARVTELLAARLGAPAVLAGYSRLFIECNRMPDAADFVAAESDGVAVPGNRGVDGAEIALRRHLAFDPFHDALTALLDQAMQAGARPVVIPVHTCCSAMNGVARPWPIGILWKRDAAFARAVIAGLNCPFEGPVGDNAPYDANLYGSMTLDTHILPRGLPHAIVEIRNDLAATESQCAKWANALSAVIDACLESR